MAEQQQNKKPRTSDPDLEAEELCELKLQHANESTDGPGADGTIDGDGAGGQHPQAAEAAGAIEL